MTRFFHAIGWQLEIRWLDQRTETHPATRPPLPFEGSNTGRPIQSALC
jgi:hypothetical protein